MALRLSETDDRGSVAPASGRLVETQGAGWKPALRPDPFSSGLSAEGEIEALDNRRETHIPHRTALPAQHRVARMQDEADWIRRWRKQRVFSSNKPCRFDLLNSGEKSYIPCTALQGV